MINLSFVHMFVVFCTTVCSYFCTLVPLYEWRSPHLVNLGNSIDLYAGTAPRCFNHQHGYHSGAVLLHRFSVCMYVRVNPPPVILCGFCLIYLFVRLEIQICSAEFLFSVITMYHCCVYKCLISAQIFMRRCVH